jgi:leucyl-tRNA synthetase
MKKYIPKDIEQKWQKEWSNSALYKFDWSSVRDKDKNYYVLVELPYPSGDLHTGHWFSWATPDALARFKRMNGYNVFFRHGFDAFGLPAENAAMKRGVHPQDWTMKNIESMTRQFKTMGSMIDWSEVTITCLPEFYKWNQWIFIKMFEQGLAYRGKTLSNWCETDQTVLANENVENGKCWRCGNEVIQKEVEQWFLKITAYADRLVWTGNEGARPERSERVDWPESVRTGQNNWIGRKEGINIRYKVVSLRSQYGKRSQDKVLDEVVCFTTRPDTNFGATFIVVAPEHDLVKKITDGRIKLNEETKKRLIEYVETAKRKTEEQRKIDARKKTGAFTGLYAINNLNNKEIPIWVSDFVLSSFGTGAVVGVPGHDQRDFEFADTFGIEIVRVVVGKDGDTSPITKKEQVQEEEGTIINSDFLNGLDIHKATKKVMDYLVEKGWGEKVVTYHIHDWSISRQRYWGTPVPMIHCEGCGILPVPEKDLPVELPYDVDFKPTGEPPLASNKEWLNVKCPKCGKDAQRDAETLDTFFDSSWYYYRYVDPHYTQAVFDKEKVKRILPVDIYFGGAEHTLGHTLYARFFTKMFKDWGLVDFEEFAKKRVQHGIVLGTDGNKMSKSKGNVVNPDDVVAEYGADTTRLYLCFMMPYDGTSAWSTETIAGVYRFTNRVWALQEKVTDDAEISNKDRYEMNRTIQKVTQDLEGIKCNTAIASIMEWLNHLSRKDKVSREEYKIMMLLMAPFAPHMTEEIWRNFFGEKESIHVASWPRVDEGALIGNEVKIPVQVNGKMRGLIMASSSELEEKDVVEKALADEKVAQYVSGRLYKVIYVKGKILNFILQ